MKYPTIIYGTAWKEEKTEECVLTALKLGYQAIDTANQRKHYCEAAVGRAIKKSAIPREQLFLQTKFTFLSGQDHRLPYDPKADFKTQVRQSLQSSLDHLQTTYLDSYIFHGPLTWKGLLPGDLEVWREMESLHHEGKIINLGISNVNIDQLKILYEKATIKPAFVQNRCYAEEGWDKEIREFCFKNNIIYQGFSLLTANRFVLSKLKEIAERVQKTPAQIIFRFAQQVGILPLTGSTSLRHLQEDITLDFDLDDKEIKYIKRIALALRELH